MARGRKPIPTKILELRGSWRAKERGGGPMPEIAIPDKPDFLHGMASDMWDVITAQLHAISVLGRIDGAALERYCRLWQRWREAEEALIPGWTGDADLARIVVAAGNLADKLLKLEHEFGMTPSGRAALGLAMAQKQKIENATGNTRKKPKARLSDAS